MLKVIIGEGVVVQHRRVVSGQIEKRRTLALGQDGSSWHGIVLKMVLIILRQVWLAKHQLFGLPGNLSPKRTVKRQDVCMKQAALSAAFATLIATSVYTGLGYFLNYGFTLTQTAIYAVIFFGFMTIADYVRSKS